MSNTPADAFEVVEATVSEVHAAMTEERLTAESLVDRYLARIDAFDDELNAVLTVNEDARDRARRLDERFEADGLVGPFHGIPVVLKDNHDTHDLPTTAGAVALSASVPPRDAFVVERLREAGAVVLAKTNLQELSFGVDTVSSLGGATRNAYDTDYRPSGSSGGTAVAVAANFATVGTGSDTCSSVRSPPAFNNLVGLRPTRGLVSRRGVVPLSETQDTVGPVTRTVGDAARMLDVVAGHDPEDPVTARGADAIPPDGYVSHLDPDGLDGARIGVARQFFGVHDDDAATEADATAVTAVVDRAVEAMAAAGATVVDPVDVVDLDRLASARVITHEFARDFERYLSTLGDAAPYDSLEEVHATGPVTPSVASRLDSGGILDVDTASVESNVGYLRRLRRRERLRESVLSRMVEDDLDALLYPPSRVPPVAIPDHQPFSEMNCELAAHTGLPAIVLPAGVTDDGLPVGVELLGRAFGEPRLFELGYAFERATDHRRPPERFGALAE
ncbi:amidase [Halogeometricum limi]|uniref:Asp-tRNAAsn/Glu-tRNAGln amidotransferase A subunit n=1 Tax=Halogeometricum limi TaxID=555875 RepID=A0A1I6GVA7_9EURY|nr:amidase family protein [Halogeometricum limi]SFR46132.1 Asp-tRNAAsn/Glu-tRNAGln amidotransferase A subunit [Halogeometricum limi]